MPKSKTTPLTIHYQQACFTLPWESNHQAVHDRVYQIVLDGQHVPDRTPTRHFIFSALPLGQSSGTGLITARATQFGDHIPAETKTLTVQAGQTVTLKVMLSALRRHRITQADQSKSLIQTPVSNAELDEWVRQTLARNAAVSAETITVLDRHEWIVRKPRQAFTVPATHVQVTGIITDAETFTRAFLEGVGRQKGYGVGMLEVIE